MSSIVSGGQQSGQNSLAPELLALNKAQLTTGLRTIFVRPDAMLSRLRWVLLLICLSWSAITLPILAFSPGTSWPFNGLAIAALLGLCGWWVYGYIHQGFPAFSAPFEAFALALVGIGVGYTPFGLCGIIFVGLFLRCLYTLSKLTLVVGGCYIAAYLAVVIFASGNPALAPEKMLFQSLGLFSVASVAYLLHSALSRQEQLATRDYILAKAGLALVTAPNRDSIYSAAFEAALALCKGIGGIGVGLALNGANGMEVVAATGVKAEQLKGASLTLQALLADAKGRLEQQQSVTIEGSANANSVTSANFKSLRLIPLLLQDRLEGVLLVGSAVPLSPDTAAALDALGPLVTLALESAMLNEDRRVHADDERFTALVQNSSDLITIIAADTTIRYQSPAAEGMFGFVPAEMIGKQLLQFTHPDDRERMMVFLNNCLEMPKNSACLECRMLHNADDWRDVEITGTNLTSEPAVQGIVLNSRDITDRKYADREILELGRYNRSLIEANLDALVVVDTNGIITDINRATERIIGLPRASLIGSELAKYLGDPVKGREALQSAKRRAMLRDFQTEIRHQRGHKTPVLFNANVYRDNKGLVIGLLVAIRDITERRELEGQLSQMAFHDSLTGLPNRSLFMDRLEHAIARSERRKSTTALLFLDLDNFKVINDSLGHQTGDELLIEVSRRILKCIRPEDTAARLGGDEFTVLLEGIAALDNATAVAERIQEQLQKPFMLAGRELFITTSIGIAVNEDGQDKAHTLLRNADIAMYAAKNKGKARFALFDPSMNVRLGEWLDLQAELRHAIEREEFKVFYQPLVDLASGEMIEVEALVRWEHPERGLVSPGEFVPVLEETGLILPVGSWVLAQAAQQIRQWQSDFHDAPPLALSVNLSAKQFQQATLVKDIAQALKNSELEPWQLKLEITETVAMEDADSTIGTFEGLKELGVRLAIDDFGTGYSSLSYLKRYAVDTLKIDRSFINGLGNNPEDSAIVQAIVAVAKTLNLRVTAEGIETTEQLAQLRAMGCDLGQGYLFARPMPAAGITKILNESRQLAAPTNIYGGLSLAVGDLATAQ